MATYTVKRTNAKGEETYNKEFSTYRKAYNALGRLQEKSSKNSTLVLLENNTIVMDTFRGLL